VAIEKLSPPIAVITTLRSAGPAVAISPAVEQPISGAPPETLLIPASSCSKSWESEQNVISSAAERPATASVAASTPAAYESVSVDWPTETHLSVLTVLPLP
jgi:hypothetical protein